MSEESEKRRLKREARLRDFGFDEPTELQRREQLAQNIAMLDWPLSLSPVGKMTDQERAIIEGLRIAEDIVTEAYGGLPPERRNCEQYEAVLKRLRAAMRELGDTLA